MTRPFRACLVLLPPKQKIRHQIVFTAKIQLFGKKVDLIILESTVDEDTKIVALTCLLISDFMQLKLS